MFTIIVLLCCVVPAFLDENNCLYGSCPSYRKDRLNVHLVCHTHDDMGWLKTVDQYYWGKNNSIQNAGVQYILNTVINELKENPHRRFTYVETGFFRKWWRQQHDFYRHAIRKLVNDGQLEFSNGGWVSHDEATPHYMGMVDQMTLGHRQLNLSFGDCAKPVVGWQIDPFGHSKESARLYAMMGLDAVFFARIHHDDRSKRLQERNMEFVWKTGNGNSDKDNILTGVFPVHYGPPDGFCFDQFCDDVLVDDKKSKEYNMDKKIEDFIAKMKDQASHYGTNHIMLTMGGDFQYQNANHWFVNLDKLIAAVNEGAANGDHNVTVYYSTPSCYVKALNEYERKWETKSDDFFPYAGWSHSYWTGYFTSRPTLKGFVRKANSLLQTCKQFDALVGLGPSDLGDLDVLKEAVATAQHHDAISGTAKQHVTDDYISQLSSGIQECQQVINDGLSKLAGKTASDVFCPLLNTSICSISTDSNEFTVRAFNGLSRARQTYTRVPVSSGKYQVTGPGEIDVEFELSKVMQTRQMLSTAPSAPYELIFPADLPPLGYSTYRVSKTPGHHQVHSAHERSAAVSIENEFLKASFNEYGKLATVTDKKTGITMRIIQDLLYYEGSIDPKQPSGAYIFRPNGTEPKQIKETATIRKLSGKNYDEVWQTFSSWATQVIRLYKGKPYLELEWTVGPIPLDQATIPNIGKEVISRFSSDIDSGDLFFTDANGRQMVQRRRNYYPTFQFEGTEPVSANYYPVNTRIFIKDDKMQMTVLTDRAQGGSSLESGSVELMVHRRLALDDHFGVGEPLNETGPDGRGLVARGRHRLYLSSVKAASKLHHQGAEEMFNHPVLTFSKEKSSAPLKFVGLNRELPANVKIATLEQWHATTILLRLEHIFDVNEDDVLSKPVTVDLKGLFKSFEVTDMTELTLSANRKINDKPRMKWNTTERPQEYRPKLK